MTSSKIDYHVTSNLLLLVRQCLIKDHLLTREIHTIMVWRNAHYGQDNLFDMNQNLYLFSNRTVTVFNLEKNSSAHFSIFLGKQRMWKLLKITNILWIKTLYTYFKSLVSQLKIVLGRYDLFIVVFLLMILLFNINSNLNKMFFF